MRCYFEWDYQKAVINQRKHDVSFEQASSVLGDAGAITVFDEEHSEDEERWVTIGLDRNGVLLVVVHTYRQTDVACVRVRLVSARKATKNEAKQYQEMNS